MNVEDLKFDLFAMLEPKNEHDIGVILEETLLEIRAVNAALDKLLAEEPKASDQA